jgi:transposase
MEVLFDRVAGLDVHRDALTACTRLPRPSGRGRLSQVAEFPTTTSGLGQLHARLVDAGVSHVAMEATGIYWRPVFWALETDFELLVVNAAHVKNVPGRKTDVADATWLAQLLECGLLRSSFVPPREIRRLRNLTRYRKTLVNERSRVVQRLEKTLQDAGVKLTSVASAAWSVSSRRIMEALISGVTDPTELAELVRGRLRAKIPALREALANHFDVHHAVIVRSGLDHLDQLDAAILAISIRINEAMAPYRWATELLCTIPGVSVRTAECLVAEIGADMSVFPTAGHLASWAGMCPGNNKSAGRSGPGTTRPGPVWLRQHLLEAAHAAARTRDNHLAARHARIRAGRGSKRAAVATGHSILIAAWHILTRREPFQNLGGDYYRANPASEARRLVKRLQALGLQVTVTPTA